MELIVWMIVMMYGGEWAYWPLQDEKVGVSCVAVRPLSSPRCTPITPQDFGQMHFLVRVMKIMDIY